MTSFAFVMLLFLKLMKCLKIQPENAKALYRRGMAYCETNSLLKAEEDLEKAKTLAENGNSIF